MKISTIKSGSMISKALFTLIVVMATVFGLQAQTGDMPKVTNFYPSIDEETPALIHANTSLYIYFNTTVAESKALVLQNDKVIGELTFAGKVPATALPVKKDMFRALLDGSALQPGKFVIKPVSVTYVTADGDRVKYEDSEGEWLTVTYIYGGESGKVATETEFANRTVKSWYPVESQDGIKTITFNKPLKTGFNVVLEYGNGESTNNFARIPVSYNLSDDDKTITIDLRGKLHSVNSMVPNAHFVDENGNPVAPPKVISLVIYDLYTIDGQPVIGVWEDTETGSQVQTTAQLYYSYIYQDLTFATPRITSAKIEGSYITIALADKGNLVSADVVFNGDKGAIGSVADVDISGSTVSVPMPAGVDADNVVSVVLENAVYNPEDGVNHVIRPFNINGAVGSAEMKTIEDIKSLAAQTKFKLVCDGVKVTYSNPEAGYIFIEDATGGIQIDPSCGFIPKEGTILTGSLEGATMADGLVTINPAKSEYVENAATIVPMDLTLDEIALPVNNCRLAAISLEDVVVEYSADDNMYLLTMENLDTPVMVILDLIDDETFLAPVEIKSLTGIVYSQPFIGGYMIVVRHKEDIQGDTSSIAVIESADSAIAPVYTVGGVKVRNAGESLDGLAKGVYVIGGKKVMVK